MSSERMEFLKRVLDADPSNVPALIELGWRYDSEEHDFGGARSLLERALAIEPTSVEAAFWLAMLYYHAFSLFEEARVQLQSVLKRDPGHAASLSLLAAIHLSLDEPETAVELLQEALRREPSWVLLHEVLDTAHSRQGNMVEAVRHARQALRLAEQFYEVSSMEPYDDFETIVTGRWISKDKLERLRQRAQRRV